MPAGGARARLARLARELLAQSEIGRGLVRDQGQVGEPEPIRDHRLQLAGWFVPVTIGDRIAGFFQFLPDGTLLRFSSFQRLPDSVEGCPSAADWLNRQVIRERAASGKTPGETLAEPYLTYDRSRTRLAWAVPVAGPEGKTRMILVAGDFVYEPVADGPCA
jgi:hypothetical protein